jgi:hypothetical protein
VVVSRFYFHVSAPGESFRDDVGSEAGDLAAVHLAALLLADRIMEFPCCRDAPFDFRRWTVRVTDEMQRHVITVIFPAHSAPEREAKAILANDAHALLLRLGGILSLHHGETRSRPS